MPTFLNKVDEATSEIQMTEEKVRGSAGHSLHSIMRNVKSDRTVGFTLIEQWGSATSLRSFLGFLRDDNYNFLSIRYIITTL